MTEEQTEAKATAEANRVKRMENAKEKKGRNIVLLKRVEEGADAEALAIAIKHGNVYVQAASENQAIRETKQAFQFMEDCEILGTLYGVRFSRYDKDGTRRGYTRLKQTTIKNV